MKKTRKPLGPVFSGFPYSQDTDSRTYVNVVTEDDGTTCTSTVSLETIWICPYSAKPVTLDTVKLLLKTGALRRMK